MSMEFSGTLRTKLPRVKTTIFTRMTQMAQANGALNLAQGFPGFHPHPDLAKFMVEALEKGKYQYAPMTGLPELRHAVAKVVESLYSAKYDSETEITITAGATQGLFSAICSLVREGDEVIVFEPAYDSYVPAIEACGGKARLVSLEGPDYSVPWDQVKKLMRPETRAILINSPHNPTGTLLGHQDLLQLEKMLTSTDVLLISDEVYEHMTFDGYEHQSVARYPNLASRAFVVGSFGKTYHATGWKTGFVLAPAPLMAEFRKMHQYQVFAVHSASQYAFARMLEEPKHYSELSAFYQQLRDIFLDELKGSAWKFSPSQGTYFQVLHYEADPSLTDEEMAKQLSSEFKVTPVPMSGFYQYPGPCQSLRFCFAKTPEELREAARRLVMAGEALLK